MVIKMDYYLNGIWTKSKGERLSKLLQKNVLLV